VARHLPIRPSAQLVRRREQQCSLATRRFEHRVSPAAHSPLRKKGPNLWWGEEGATRLSEFGCIGRRGVRHGPQTTTSGDLRHTPFRTGGATDTPCHWRSSRGTPARAPPRYWIAAMRPPLCASQLTCASQLLARVVYDVLDLDRLGVRVLSVREPWLATAGPVRASLWPSSDGSPNRNAPASSKRRRRQKRRAPDSRPTP
jgi:hypothetical protein